MDVSLTFRPELSDLEIDFDSLISSTFEFSIDSTTDASYLQNCLGSVPNDRQLHIHVTQPCIADVDFETQIRKIAALLSEINPWLISFHFSVEKVNGGLLPGMMPILGKQLYETTLRNLDAAKSLFTSSNIALENIASNWITADQVNEYLSLLGDTIKSSQSSLLLDLTNLEIMTSLSGTDLDMAFDKLATLPIACIHLGGIEKADKFLVDFHGGSNLGDSIKLIRKLHCSIPIVVEVDQSLASPEQVVSDFLAICSSITGRSPDLKRKV